MSETLYLVTGAAGFLSPIITKIGNICCTLQKFTLIHM